MTDISKFGTSNSMDLSFGSPAEAKTATLTKAAEVKASSVSDIAAVKTAQLGGKSIFEQGLYGKTKKKNRIATAILEGTELGQSEGARDLLSGSEAIAGKYGAAAAFDVSSFADTFFQLKNKES